MSINTNVVAMIGYDISHLSGYIQQLEDGNEEWLDGIPEYSLNSTKNEIGYEPWTKQMFGMEIFNFDDGDNHEEGIGKSLSIDEMQERRAAIWEKYKLFLFDHTKLTDKEEPPFVLNFITYFS